MGLRFESLDGNFIPPEPERKKITPDKREKADKMLRASRVQNKRLQKLHETDWETFKRMAKQAAVLLTSISVAGGAGLKIGEYLDHRGKPDDRMHNAAKLDDRDSPSRQNARELLAKYELNNSAAKDALTSTQILDNNKEEFQIEKSDVEEKAAQRIIQNNNLPEKHESFFSHEGPKQPVEKKVEVQKGEIPDLKKIIKYKKHGRIIYNMDTAREITAGWKLKHEKEPVYKNSFDFAIKKLAPYKEAMEQEFEKAGVPIEFVFLSVPESYWNNKPSKKGAVGVFQITKDIGRQFGMIINENIDERHDPIKSAHTAARLLKDNYNKLGQSWNLALSAYNGHMVWDYAGQAKSKGEKLSYENYLNYKENDINKKKNEIDKNVRTIEIKKAITLYELAKQYGTSVEAIKSLNRLRTDHLRHGHKIKLPLSDQEKEEQFYEKVAGDNENLNYPPRYVGIISIIKERGIDKARYRPIAFTTMTVKQPKLNMAASVQVRKKDTIESIAKRFKISKDAILSANPNLHPAAIRAGSKINIPDKNFKPINLFTFARDNDLSFVALQESNSDITNPLAALPDGWKLKINTK